VAHTAQPSITTRLIISKTVGLLFGVLALIGLSVFLPDSDLLSRFGLMLWYFTMGGFIGIVGVLDTHPVLYIRLPWWVRGPCVGAWMNFVLVFFAYDLMAEVILQVTGYRFSPFWFALDGAVIGGVIGGVSTYFGGEGPETLQE
jgi:hypothetical protein